MLFQVVLDDRRKVAEIALVAFVPEEPRSAIGMRSLWHPVRVQQISWCRFNDEHTPSIPKFLRWRRKMHAFMSGVLMMMTSIVSSSDSSVIKDGVDLVEVNHYHDARGEHVFDQLIFYDWSSQKRRFQVRAWRLIKSESQLPQRDFKNGTWLVRWHDDGVLREVTAASRRETWTQYDPELVERENLPQDQRLDLSPASVSYEN